MPNPFVLIVHGYKNSHAKKKIVNEKIIEPKVSLELHPLLPKSVPHISTSKIKTFSD